MNDQETKARKREYYLRNKDKICAAVKAYQIANKEKISEKNKLRRAADPARWKAYYRKQYLKHKEKFLERCRAYHWKNREIVLEKMRALYRKNAEARKEKQRRYYKTHKKQVQAYEKEYARKYPDRIKARCKRYRAENGERLRAYDRWRAKNMTPKRKRSHRAWFKNNPDKVKAYSGKKFIRARLILGNRCIQCDWNKHTEILEIDHKISFMSLGTKRPKTSSVYDVFREPEKFQLLCPNCHAIKTSLEKRARNPHMTEGKLEYQAKRDRLIRKFGGLCLQCGYGENKLAFEFDHIDPIWGEGRSSAVHHATKHPERFQMLCANCHTLKTRVDFEKKRKTS